MKNTVIAIILVVGAVCGVFWFKKTAQILPRTSSFPNTYRNQGIAIGYPADFTVAPYTYQELGPGKEIQGVKFTIPETYATGTNLASDTYLSVERLPGITNCDATLFISDASSSLINDNGVQYSYASTIGAAAGNRYEETVYALQGSPCTAVRYFIHYGVIENYPAGAVKEFNEGELKKTFDAMRRTLHISYQ